jgi:hypothetical protein
MENKKLDELKKERPSIEEQIAFIQNMAQRSVDRLEKMKRENPDVVEWIKNGKPDL